jgi:hypothetical protein
MSNRQDIQGDDMIGWHALSTRRAWLRLQGPHALRVLRACHPALLCTLFASLILLSGCSSKPPPGAGNVSYPSRLITKPGYVPPPTPAIEKATPEFTVTADALWGELTRTPKEAKEKYDGKIIEVTGTVRIVQKNFNEQWVLYLNAAGDPRGIECIFYSNAEPAAAPGQQVRIRGVNIGLGMGNCLLVK